MEDRFHLFRLEPVLCEVVEIVLREIRARLMQPLVFRVRQAEVPKIYVIRYKLREKLTRRVSGNVRLTDSTNKL